MGQALQLYDQNCYGYQGGFVQYPSVSTLSFPRPNACELVVEKVGDKVTLDYGSEIRLLIADPVKGAKMREAIEQLKEALIQWHQ